MASRHRILPNVKLVSSGFCSSLCSYAISARGHSCSFSYQLSWIFCTQNISPGFSAHKTSLLDFLHTKHLSWISCAQNNVHGFCAHNAKYRPYLNLPLAINQSIFYVCSHQGDIRQKQTKTTKHIIIIYTYFPTELGTIDLTFKLAFKLNC